MSREFFGKYRGRVASNTDPNQMGRLQVVCPAVLGKGKKSWAMPCVPYAGKDVGWFALPPKDAWIWVEFEGGDPDYPIWSGCFWAKGEVPANPAAEHIKILKTEHATLQIDDSADGAGSLLMELDSDAANFTLKVSMNADGIEIDHDGQRIFRIGEETIEIVNADQAKTTWTDKDIMLESSPVEIKLLKDDPAIKMAAGSSSSAEISGDLAGLKQGPSELKLTSSGAEMICSSSASRVKPEGVALECAPAAAKFGSAGIELDDGAGGMLKMQGPMVNVNNGALEVT